VALFGKKDTNKKIQARYPSPIILLLAAIYLGFMAYNLAVTLFNGSVSGTELVVTWIGMIAFILLAIGLVVLAIFFDKQMKMAVDEEIAREKAELDSITLEDLTEDDDGDEEK
jgi:protein-S-isoprenylcysteine O-methyltransferase Ste14